MATQEVPLDQVAKGELSVIGKAAGMLEKLKPQLAAALPKHMNPDRVARIALTSMRKNPKLLECTPTSIAGAVVTLSQLGLEIDVLGAAYLVPYWDNRKRQLICQAIPGWKGLVDLVNRAGRATVWTGAHYEGDAWDYSLGDSPFVKHRPADREPTEGEALKLLHTYACGRVNGASMSVIDVWPEWKIKRHLKQYNKVGDKHYALQGDNNWEMYARKVPLLQVLKYMPKSIELANAMVVANAADAGDYAAMMSGDDFVTVIDGETGEITEGMPEGAREPASTNAPAMKRAAPSAQPARTFAQIAAAMSKAGSESEMKLLLEEAADLPPDQLADLIEHRNRVLAERKGASK